MLFQELLYVIAQQEGTVVATVDEIAGRQLVDEWGEAIE
jgi:hypothetical protein